MMTGARAFAAALAAAVVACGGAVRPPGPSEPLSVRAPAASAVAASATPTAASAVAASASATPTARAAPASAGAVPDAGVLLVRGADGGIHRYDGRTGALERVAEQGTLLGETGEGAQVAAPGSASGLLRWDGATASVRDQPSPPAVPAEWRVSGVAASPDGRRVLFIRTIEPRPGPGMDPGLSALYLQEPDARVRELYRPPRRGVLHSVVWSPDGTKALVTQVETTSNSFAADGVGVSTILIDLSRGTTRTLGTVMNGTWTTWAPDGRLAFVRGGGRGTWWDKALVVMEPDGTERTVRGAEGRTRVGIAPAWGPGGELGWVSGPAENTLSGVEYVAGRGVGARVAMIEVAAERREVGCADGRVVEGLRWSGDGAALLLLCRVPGSDPLPLELWLYRLADGSSQPLVRRLLSRRDAGGFGYYGMQPPITSVAAWSLGYRR